MTPALILRDHEMPAWVLDVLSPAQADEDRTSANWRWRVLVGALDLPGPTKATALWLAHHCTASQPWCWPATTTLAHEAGFGRKAVERAIRTLEEHGLVYVQRERFERDRRRKANVYALAWPASSPTGAVKELCSRPGRRGEPCQRAAGWGVDGATKGPCKYHLVDEMSASDASMSASRASSVGIPCQQMSAREHRKGSSSEGSSSEGSSERAARFAASSGEGQPNDRTRRHAFLLALLEEEKERTEREGLSDWSSEFDQLLEVEKAREALV